MSPDFPIDLWISYPNRKNLMKNGKNLQICENSIENSLKMTKFRLKITKFGSLSLKQGTDFQ